MIYSKAGVSIQLVTKTSIAQHTHRMYIMYITSPTQHQVEHCYQHLLMIVNEAGSHQQPENQ